MCKSLIGLVCICTTNYDDDFFYGSIFYGNQFQIILNQW